VEGRKLNRAFVESRLVTKVGKLDIYLKSRV
jgi:hypothetical protein